MHVPASLRRGSAWRDQARDIAQPVADPSALQPLRVANRRGAAKPATPARR